MLISMSNYAVYLVIDALNKKIRKIENTYGKFAYRIMCFHKVSRCMRRRKQQNCRSKKLHELKFIAT